MTHDHDRGLAYDLPKLISRRRAITLLGGSVASAGLAACAETSGSVDSGIDIKLNVGV